MQKPCSENIENTSFLLESVSTDAAKLVLVDKERDLFLYQANCLTLMDALIKMHPEGCFDMIFADPPYFLSNGGFTCKSGKQVPVNKGKWDKSQGVLIDHQFNKEWLEKCQQLLKPNGTIWVSGTMHNIFSVGLAMQELGFKVLNNITWEKPNPPPNLSCRYFTHSTETLIWAAKSLSSKYKFNYKLMKQENGGKQMKSVWSIAPPSKQEKLYGKHPTQKPLNLLRRCIEASTDKGDFIFDPFAGSSTTGVAALQHERGFCGAEIDEGFIALSMQRLTEITE